MDTVIQNVEGKEIAFFLWREDATTISKASGDHFQAIIGTKTFLSYLGYEKDLWLIQDTQTQIIYDAYLVEVAPAE